MQWWTLNRDNTTHQGSQVLGWGSLNHSFWADLNRPAQNLFWAPICSKLPKTYFCAPICQKLLQTYFYDLLVQNCPKPILGHQFVQNCPEPILGHLCVPKCPKPILGHLHVFFQNCLNLFLATYLSKTAQTNLKILRATVNPLYLASIIFSVFMP